MSKYTDYLNTNSTIDYKDFIKVCAWNAKQLSPYKPEELYPVEEKIELNITGLNTQLDVAMDNLQDLESMTPEEQTSLRDKAFDDIEDTHWSKINELENLITVYGAILSDLCRWNPTNSEMKTLKAFAIKELTSNMPDLSKYASSPAQPSVSSYIEGLRKGYNSEIAALTKQITAESKNNIVANEYISLLLSELEKAPSAENTEENLIPRISI